MSRRQLSALALALALAVLGGAAAAQCPGTPESPVLSVSPYPQLGGFLTLGLSGDPLLPFALAADDAGGPIPTPVGNLCLSPDFFLLVDPGQHPFAVLPPGGTFAMTLAIPDDPALLGQTWHFQGATFDLAQPGASAVRLSNGASITIDGPQAETVVFEEDFEPGHGFWSVSNGLWAIGVPAVGPPAAWTGSQCAGTNLVGPYAAAGHDTRLQSPTIVLPPVGPDEELRLTWRVWFSTENNQDDYQLQVLDLTGGTGSWDDVGAPSSGSSVRWTQAGADLTPYAGHAVRLGFRFRSRTCQFCPSVAGDGVYIDAVRVVRGTPFFNVPEDWEQGIGTWWTVDNGLWQVGEPSNVGPTTVPSGTRCAGTYVDADYPAAGSDTRLVSPPITVPSTPFPGLVFDHWFDMENNVDLGRVQVRAWDAQSGTWSAWTTVGGTFTGSSAGWTTALVDLVDLAQPPAYSYAGERVQVGFFFTSTTCQFCPSRNGAGWYVDDVRIVP